MNIDFTKLSQEDRERIARHMVVPFRCGGCHYTPEGERVYIVGGREVLEKDLDRVLKRAPR